MGAHLIGGDFQSDKYPTCPRGKVPLSVRDATAQDLLWKYAQRRRSVDAEFSDDLEVALQNAGYEPPDNRADFKAYVIERDAKVEELRSALHGVVAAIDEPGANLGLIGLPKDVAAAARAALGLPKNRGWYKMNAIADIAAERARQVEREGWTLEHDDAHKFGEMARAASTYALAGSWPTDQENVKLARDMEAFLGADTRTGREPVLICISKLWPWDWSWWKPTNRRRNLVKAGALIVAEIERLDRAVAGEKET